MSDLSVPASVPYPSERVCAVADWLLERGHPQAPVWLDVAARTAAEAATALGVTVGQIAKSVVFRRVADDAAVLVVASGDRRVDERKVAALVGPIGRANAAFVRERTGFVIGGVAPVAHAGPVVTLLDSALWRFDRLWAAAGHPNAVFPLNPEDLRRLSPGAPVADVVEAQAVAVVSSPCVNVCRMDAQGVVCEGCLRTIEEIAGWSRLDDHGRRQVLERLAQRRGASA
jgi:prolyl-tRNA editing enzyme YbaK/EbsC (Cys-tRNA(Pro) deacylase)/predicted Fe-S protein YdhL (DUF1289 family)